VIAFWVCSDIIFLPIDYSGSQGSTALKTAFAKSNCPLACFPVLEKLVNLLPSEHTSTFGVTLEPRRAECATSALLGVAYTTSSDSA
jgi:hypothetical protein